MVQRIIFQITPMVIICRRNKMSTHDAKTAKFWDFLALLEAFSRTLSQENLADFHILAETM